jgi:glycosyltransferase involved in cell wall biosynthesis
MNAKERWLHICCWYPNHDNPKEALWIRDHIRSLEPYTDNHVIHFEVKQSDRWAFDKGDYSDNESFFILKTPIKTWFFIELLASGLLAAYLFFFVKLDSYKGINFHIAYPLLTYFHYWKKLIKKKKIVVTEHWSAYHYNFSVANPHKTQRAKNIFRHNEFTLVVVSKALGEDIRHFSGCANLPYHIVPNVVSLPFTNIKQHKEAGGFFMINNWGKPKRPLLVLEAYKKYLAIKGRLALPLIIAGYGTQIPDIQVFIEEHHLNAHIQIVGKLDKAEIAWHMESAAALLQPSDYETFSVVTAEALCCGLPVIASNVGGIKELITDAEYGLLVNNELSEWVNALTHFDADKYSRDNIKTCFQKRYSSETVGYLYSHVLSD